MVCGLVAIAAGSATLLGVSSHADGYLFYLIPAFVLMGTGLGSASVASTAVGTAAADGGLQGLASGLLNSAAQIGTVLGLAVLIPLSAARTQSLAATIPDDAALVGGFKLAFLGATVIAACGITIATLLTGQERQETEPSSDPTGAVQ
jgi:hypothetical protein